MKRFCVSALFVALTLVWAGCKPSTDPGAVVGGHEFPTDAQHRLKTIKLWIGAQEMVTEVALTAREQETGMMFRTNMGTNEGMLFPFARPTLASFWMKNTVLPLSAAYISANGTIVEIHDLKPLDTNSVASATANILYVLETPQGWFQTNHIGVGTTITTERGSLRKVIFGQ